MKESRYLRHSLIDWFDQEAVRAARVIVVGAGATGNEVVKNLCLLGVGHVHIVDYDQIEPHNLTSAVLFTESDVGRYKAEAASESCKSLDPGVMVTYSTEDFWKSLSIDEIRSCDALFCCVDNFEARIRLNHLCLVARTDLYNIAINSRFVAVEKYPFHSSLDCACYECNLPESAYERIRERYSCGWLKKRALEERKIPTTTITASIAGAQVCSLYLHGKGAQRLSEAIRYFTDTISLSLTSSRLIRNTECPACSGLSRECQYFRVKRSKLPAILHNYESSGNLNVQLSDKIILDVRCKVCGCQRAINDVVDKYDDSLLYCDQCGLISNDVAMQDTMTVSELSAAFSDSQIPAKYLTLTMNGLRFVFELED